MSAMQPAPYSPPPACPLPARLRAPTAPPHTPAPCSSTVDQWLLYDAMRAQLLDPDLANDSVHFMELQVRA